MKISVVIPTYKRPALLLRCLDALYDQQFPSEEYEIIVVSDGRDELTLQALKRLATKETPVLKYFQLPVKRGPAAARNAGWREALSDIVAFTDDDCIPDRYWLTNFYEAFLNHGQEDIAFTGRTIVPISSHPTDYEVNISHLATAEFITANCACSKSTLANVGGFDEAFTMAWREDSDLQFKLIKNGVPIRPVPSALVTHPVRKAPWGVSIKEEKKGVFNALLYKKFPDLYRQKIQQQPPWLYYAILFFFVLFIVGVGLQQPGVIALGLSGWGLLTSWFVFKRLRFTTASVSHVLEMIVTSMAIPFLSLYWRWYGAIKYKTFLF
jgi:GT2 family glycosyltransferase